MKLLKFVGSLPRKAGGVLEDLFLLIVFGVAWLVMGPPDDVE